MVSTQSKEIVQSSSDSSSEFEEKLYESPVRANRFDALLKLSDNVSASEDS